MAKKSKKPVLKPKKKGRKSNNIITRIIVIIFVLILAFFLIFSVFKPGSRKQMPEVPATNVVENQQSNNVKPDENSEPKADVKEEVKEEVKAEDKAEEQISKKEEKKAAETKTVEQSITGKWMSTTGGAFLTMGNNKYKIDFMGVDIGKPIEGTYTVSGDIITFVNKEDPCKDVTGVYEVSFDKQEIGFKYKSDECTKRKAVLPTEWEWLGIN